MLILGRFTGDPGPSFVGGNQRVGWDLKIYITAASQDKQARCWSPPVLGRWKINTDAALDVAKGVVGVGIIIRNSLGQVAEAVALLLRISFAVNSGLCPASLESDATVVAAVVNTCAPLVPEFGTVLHDVLGAINCFNISPLRQRMR
ncbi:hypothetical protein ACOSP7_013323 [Xanthoceras sorbifolium]